MITVRFACGHEQSVPDSTEATPQCQTCGEHRIQRTTAPPPRFRGMCAGPLKKD